MTIWLPNLNAGYYPGGTQVIVDGHNPDIDIASTPEDIWEGGGVYNWMTAATSLEVASSSANDTAAGTGMRTIVVQALTTNYVVVTLTITLNGTTPVPFPQQIYRINRVINGTSGSLGVNAGDITIRDAGGGTVRDLMPAGYGVAKSSAYTVPAGYTLLIASYSQCINRSTATRDVSLSLMVRNPAGAFFLASEIGIDGNPLHRAWSPPIQIPEKFDVIFRCTASSNDNMSVVAGFIGILNYGVRS